MNTLIKNLKVKKIITNGQFFLHFILKLSLPRFYFK